MKLIPQFSHYCQVCSISRRLSTRLVGFWSESSFKPLSSFSLSPPYSFWVNIKLVNIFFGHLVQLEIEMYVSFLKTFFQKALKLWRLGQFARGTPWFADVFVFDLYILKKQEILIAKFVSFYQLIVPIRITMEQQQLCKIRWKAFVEGLAESLRQSALLSTVTEPQ